MSERDTDDTSRGVRRLVSVSSNGGLAPTGADPMNLADVMVPDPAGGPLSSWMGAWLMQLRQRWLLASLVAILVVIPIAAYAVLAVPSYTSNGVLQVSTQQGGLDPMLELIGGGGSGEIETEVEIIRRREFVLAVLKDLRLQVVESGKSAVLTSDPGVSLGGRSPTSDALVRVRAVVETAEVASHRFQSVELELVGIDDTTIGIDVVDGEDREHLQLVVGEALQHDSFALSFVDQPLERDETLSIKLLPDGELYESSMQGLSVSSMGDQRHPTNLVSVSFTHQDRDIARAVVDGIMQRYLAQSLNWQSQGAAKAADFIERRLTQAEEDLRAEEEKLRAFAEKERAVQLDTQARVTIENAAALEAERRQTELQETVLGSVIAGMKSRARAGEGAHLTSSFFEDPVLGASIGSLTEAETKYAMLSATLTADHPQVLEVGRKIELQRKEVGRLLKTAKQSVAARKREIEKQLEGATAALADYPEKDVQMARLMRDVEVSQKLYAFLLERHREAEIVEASTTIDKRVVDAASLPHRVTTPKRGRLLATGLASAVLAAFGATWLAHALQRRLHTVEAIKRELPVAVYGSLPQMGNVKTGRARLDLSTVWGEAHGPSAEAFRALCVSVALSPSRGRGRVIQVTSSQPGEGKSTVIANLAVSLRKTGASVLIVDVDLRKPVQHRQWKVARSPGYAELVANGGGTEQSKRVTQHVAQWDLDVCTAGAKLPDTMSSLMSPLLAAQIEDWSSRYDFVLLDSPPAFVPDTTIVARHADLVLVVARPGVVERASLRHAITALSRVQVAKGLVLNGVTRRHSEDYYGSGYAYAYGTAYGESNDRERAAS
jgi:succinoglycan biosynthesis transport protein ExoP